MKTTFRRSSPLRADGLTDRQREVLDFLIHAYTSKGVPATLRDIIARFGFSSTNAAMCHVKPLLLKGRLRTFDKQSHFCYVPAGYVVVAQADLDRLKALEAPQ